MWAQAGSGQPLTSSKGETSSGPSWLYCKITEHPQAKLIQYPSAAGGVNSPIYSWANSLGEVKWLGLPKARAQARSPGATVRRNAGYPPWQKRGLRKREEVRPSGEASRRKRRRPRAEQRRGEWGAERQEAGPAPHPAWASTAGRDATGPAREEPPLPARDPGPARSGSGRPARPRPPQTRGMGREWRGPDSEMEGLSSFPQRFRVPQPRGLGLRRRRPAEIRRRSPNRGVPRPAPGTSTAGLGRCRPGADGRGVGRAGWRPAGLGPGCLMVFGEGSWRIRGLRSRAGRAGKSLGPEPLRCAGQRDLGLASGYGQGSARACQVLRFGADRRPPPAAQTDAGAEEG